MSKRIIIELIEQRLPDREISNRTGKSLSNVKVVRANYNKVATEKIRSKKAPLTQPKAGTISKRVYDFLIENPGIVPFKAALILNVNAYIVAHVRRRYMQGGAA